MLGAFGREGLYLGKLGNGPGNGALPGYIKAAFKLFRNYDSEEGEFGDTAVDATLADNSKASIYAATDTKRKGLLTVLVINKEARSIFNAKIDLKGGEYSKAQVYTLDASSTDIKPQAPMDVKDGVVQYKLAPDVRGTVRRPVEPERVAGSALAGWPAPCPGVMNSGERGLGGGGPALRHGHRRVQRGRGRDGRNGWRGRRYNGRGRTIRRRRDGWRRGRGADRNSGHRRKPLRPPTATWLPVTAASSIVLDTSASMADPIESSVPERLRRPVQVGRGGGRHRLGGRRHLGRVRMRPGVIVRHKGCLRPDLGSLVGGGSVELALANRTSAGSLTVPGSRPTRAAIDLAARSLAAESGPGRVIVLITDGSPGCKAGDSDVLASDTADTLRAVTTAFGAGVPTFVVGLGTWNGPADRDLSDIAIYGGLSRGGSPAYNPASSSGDVVIALNALVTAMDCFFLLPPPYGGDFTVIAGGLAIPQDSLNGGRTPTRR